MKKSLLLVLPLLAALVAVSSGGAAERMWLGFQDDPNFRWQPDRSEMIVQAALAKSTILRTWVYWAEAAPTRPANPRDPFDPAYHWDDLDEFMRTAQLRGQEVLLTIWTVPSWANGGKKRNVVPKRAQDYGDFCYAVAKRYSGRYRDLELPFVRFYTIWNEPNLNMFLSPQFVNGKPVGPHNYALLARAGYKGIKQGNPKALVAIGDSSPRGKDRAGTRFQESFSPGKWAELLSLERPRLKFDAWAHHPYVPIGEAPLRKTRWPDVTLTQLVKFEQSLDQWWGKKDIPIWIDEYAQETRPENSKGITYAQQAKYVRQVLATLRKDPRVQMFIWFVLRDGPSSPWKSGLLAEDNTPKPALDAFAGLAAQMDARNAIVTVKPKLSNPPVTFGAREIAAHSQIGDVIGINYTIFDGARPIFVGQAATHLALDATGTFNPVLRPLVGHTYVVKLTAGNIHGDFIKREITLVAPRPALPAKAPAKSPAKQS